MNQMAIRRPTPWKRIAAVAAIAGPGLIAANAGNDAGGIATYASAGSQFGYRTIFLMVLVTIGLVLVQEMSARLGAHTGEGLVSLFREHFSLRTATFAMVMLLIANLGLVVSEFAGIGAALEMAGVSRYMAVPVAAAAIWALVVFGSYRYAERIFLLFTLAFLGYPIAAILSHPHWRDVAANAAVPHLLGSAAFITLAIQLVGTTITPYMQLFQAAAVADRPGSVNLRVIRLDAVSGAIFANVISIFIIIATAAAIGGSGPLASADQAAKALVPVAGHGAEALFAFGLFGAAALAAAVVPLSTSYALAEAVGVERSVSNTFKEAPLFLGMFTFQIVIGAVVALAPGNLITLLLNMQTLNGVITPIILGFILVLANRRSVLGENVNGPVFRVAAAACVVVVGALALVFVYQTVQGWGWVP